MFPSRSSRIVFSLLPMLAGFGLLTLAAYLNSLDWQPILRPIWGWMLCGLGSLIIIISITDLWRWPPIIDDRVVLALVWILGLLFLVIGWSLESTLLLFWYLVIGFLTLAGFGLFVFGACVGTWQIVVITWRVSLNVWQVMVMFFERSEHYKGFDYSKHYRRFDENADDPFTDQQEHTDDAGDPQEEVPVSFNPHHVLRVPPDATQEAIRKAYREKIKLNHPDKVAHLSKDIQEMAERQTKDLNRAYDMLRQR